LSDENYQDYEDNDSVNSENNEENNDINEENSEIIIILIMGSRLLRKGQKGHATSYFSLVDSMAKRS